MTPYEEKRQARIERLRARAAAKRGERNQRRGTVDRLCEVMNGQPILVGHHSERRHRRDLERMSRTIRKCVELDEQAERLEERAQAAEASTAISSDDPEAVRKLEAQIAEREAFRDRCKAVNAKIRAAVRAAQKKGEAWEPEARRLLTEELGLSPMSADAALAPDYAGRRGVPGYVLTNTGSEIRRLRKRLEALREAAAREGRELVVGETRIVEEENRVRVFFPAKPSEEVRASLKGSGFRWARSIGAWQRHASAMAWAAAERIVRGASI